MSPFLLKDDYSRPNFQFVAPRKVVINWPKKCPIAHAPHRSFGRGTPLGTATASMLKVQGIFFGNKKPNDLKLPINSSPPKMADFCAKVRLGIAEDWPQIDEQPWKRNI